MNKRLANKLYFSLVLLNTTFTVYVCCFFVKYNSLVLCSLGLEWNFIVLTNKKLLQLDPQN